MQAVTEQVVKLLAGLHHRPRRQPARRDVPGGLPAERVPARARHRHGRRARLGAHAHVHRRGAERLGARTSTRSSSAATATRWCRCRATRRSRGIPLTELLSEERIEAICEAHGRRRRARSPSWSAPAPGTRRARRRPRWSSAILKDKKKILPCSVFLQGEYGINGPVPRRAGQARRQGRRADHRDHADGRREGGAQQVGGAVRELTA